MRLSVVTVAAGRHDHLAAQLRGLDHSTEEPTSHVVVAMGDRDIADVVQSNRSRSTCIYLDASRARLPIARARNIGARAALDGGADLVVFLDVDCIPGADMLSRYRSAASDPAHAGSLLCGPVTYLPDIGGDAWEFAELDRNTAPHPARPNPPSGSVIDGEDFDLFWSLSFAVTKSTWNAIGGFYEGYEGYGGEDTDFAATAGARGVGLRWVGGAHAYHQHHPVSRPPVEHLDDIVRNSVLFNERWNRWPMEGWLSDFERRGLITRTERDIVRTAEQ